MNQKQIFRNKADFMAAFSRATPMQKQILINNHVNIFDMDFLMYLLGISNPRIYQVRGQTPQAPFQLLGLPNTASLSEVNSAYRKQCLRNHPDKGGDPNKFVKITKAKNECIKILTNK